LDQRYRIGVLGGSGYIGHYLGERLSRNFDVSAIDVNPPRDRSRNVRYVQCDVTRLESLDESLRNVDLVINAAIVQIPAINTQKRQGYEVNVVGTQNACKVAERSRRIRGMIAIGTWHTMGERGLEGTIDETYGLRPDKLEDRARLYGLSKIIQECIVRFYDEFSEKVFAVVRLGTVLGEGMPEKTAANIFIEKGLAGQSLTPYRHSMHRPMLYIDRRDVGVALEKLAKKILEGRVEKGENSLEHVANFCYPEPVTILELAHIIRNSIIRRSNRAILPSIEIIETNDMFVQANPKVKIHADLSKAARLLGVSRLRSPQQSIDEIIKVRLGRMRLRER
jgi:nucleoside-diphosphate-sugar epimerase